VVVAIDQDPATSHPHQHRQGHSADARDQNPPAEGAGVGESSPAPGTTVARTLLDLAATLPFADVRRARAEADHRRLLRPQEVERVLGRGRPGSAALRGAVERHLPALAETLSALEERFLILCESSGMTPPEVNVTLAGLKVDALWRGQRVIVELDGHEAHSYPAAAERDRRRDLILRGAGYKIRR
jgi:hypothetical protein